MKHKHTLSEDGICLECGSRESIFCVYCKDLFCVECSDSDSPDEFCSQECQDDYEAETMDEGSTLVPYGDQWVNL